MSNIHKDLDNISFERKERDDSSQQFSIYIYSPTAFFLMRRRRLIDGWLLKVVHNHQPYSDCETVVASRRPSIHIYIYNKLFLFFFF